MRNHEDKFERFECGEGPTCNWINAALGFGGALLGYLGSKNQADAQREANEANKPQFLYASPEAQAFDQRLLNDVSGMYANQALVPQANPVELLARQNLLGVAEGPMSDLINAGNASLLQGLDARNTYGQFNNEMMQHYLNPNADPMQFLNPHLDEMIGIGLGRLGEQFNESIMPAVQDRSIASGGFGGSAYDTSAERAARDMSRTMADYDTKMRSAGFDTAVNRHTDLARQALGIHGQLGTSAMNHQANLLGLMPELTLLNRLPADIQSEVGQRYMQDTIVPYLNAVAAQKFVDPLRGFSGGSAAVPVDANPFTGALQGLGVAGSIDWGNVFGGGGASGGSGSGSLADWHTTGMIR